MEQLCDLAMLINIDQRIFVRCWTTIMAQEKVHIAFVDTVAPDLFQAPDYLALLVDDHDDEARMMFLLGLYFWWQSNTYTDLEVRAYGGEKLGGLTYDAHYEGLLPEQQHKRHCRGVALVFILFGGLTLSGLAMKRQQQAELEKSWGLAISTPQAIEDLRCYPQLYPRDFRQWAKETHPGVLS